MAKIPAMGKSEPCTLHPHTVKNLADDATIAQLQVMKFLTISLCLTKIYVTSSLQHSNSNSVISHIQRYPPTLSNSAYVPEANLILQFLCVRQFMQFSPFCLILASLLCSSISQHTILPWAYHSIERESKEARMRPENI